MTPRQILVRMRLFQNPPRRSLTVSPQLKGGSYNGHPLLARVREFC
jgi:hypothetical protein